MGAALGTAFGAESTFEHACTVQVVSNCPVLTPGDGTTAKGQSKRAALTELRLSFDHDVSQVISNDFGWTCQLNANHRNLTCTGLGAAADKVNVAVSTTANLHYRGGWFAPDKGQPGRVKQDPVVTHDLCDTPGCVSGLPLGGSATHTWTTDIETGHPLGNTAMFYGPGWNITSLPDGTVVGTEQENLDFLCDGSPDTLGTLSGGPSASVPLLAQSTNWEATDPVGRLESYLNDVIPGAPSFARVARYRADFDGVWLFGGIDLLTAADLG